MRGKKVKNMIAFIMALIMVFPALISSATEAEATVEDNQIALFDLQVALADIPVGTVIDGYLNGMQPAGPAVLTVVEHEGRKGIEVTNRTESWHALDIAISSFALDWYPGQSYDFSVSGFTNLNTTVQVQLTDLWQPMIPQGAHNGAFTRTHNNRVLTEAQGNAFREQIRIQTTHGTSPYIITDFTIKTTPRETDWHLVPSLWEAWEDYFPIGNIDSSTYNTNANSPNGTQYARDMFLRHYNMITAENNMKPDTYGSQANHPTHTNARRLTMLEFAQENDIPVHGHTMIWHSQSATWMTQTGGTLANPIGIRTRAEAKANMEVFIRGIGQLYEVNYPGVVVSWDVINEAFENGNGIFRESLRENIPWFLAFDNGADREAGEWGGDFIYYAFVFARRYAPNANLFYNDYNMDTPSKFTAVADMVRQLNAKWARDTVNNPQAMPNLSGSYMEIINAYKAAGGRILIETVGFQSHYIVGANFRHIEDGFQTLVDSGVNIAVTELDVAIPNTPWWGPDEPTDEQFLDQGRWVAELMQIHRRFADYMENVSIWGIGDRHSWLNGAAFGAAYGMPFDHSQPIPQAKPMFWALLEPDRFIAQYGRFGDDEDRESLVRQFSFAPQGTVNIENFDLAQWQVAPTGWARNTSEIRSNRFVDNTTEGATGLTRVLWDDDYLYVRVEVSDPGPLFTHANPWENDSIEVFFSESRNRTSLFRTDGSDGQYRVNFRNEATFDRGANTAVGFESHVQVTEGVGYVVQMKIPFRLGAPSDLQDVGFDVQINTNTGAGRTGVAVWSDLSNGGLWQSPAPMGQLTLSKTANPIRLDHIAGGTAVFGSPSGIADPIWEEASLIPVNQWTSDAMVRGATGLARTMWDEDFLYAVVEVTDCLIDTSNGSTWLQDSIEFCLDLNNLRRTDYPSLTNGGQYRVTLDGGVHTNPGGLASGVESEVQMTATGYIIYIAIPIGHMNFSADTGSSVSFDIQINDAANGTRFGISTWSDATASGFNNSARFGHLSLAPESTLDSDVWRLADPANIQIGRNYIVVSEFGALTNEGMIFYEPAQGRDDPTGFIATPVTIANNVITSNVTPEMIWQFGEGNNVAAAAGGLGVGSGFHLMNDAPGADAGRFPLRRDGSLNFPTAPIMTTSMAVPNNQSLLMHVLNAEDKIVSLYFWSGNNAWNFALEGTELGFTARGASSTAAQLMPFLQNAPLRLFELATDVTQHSIVSSAGPNGSISPTSLTGHVWVDEGDDKTFTFTPAFGFVVDTVVVNGEAVNVTNNTFTFRNVTTSGQTIHVTFRAYEAAVEKPFIVFNDIFPASGIVPFVYTTAVIIDLGEGNTANLADVNKDMFTVSARNTRLNGTTVVFEGDRTITRAYVNTQPVPLGYISPAPGSPDLVTETPVSGRFIILELDFFGPAGPILAARADDGPNSTILNYRINMDQYLVFTSGGVSQSIVPRFEQDRVVAPAIDRFVPDRTNPGGAGDMRILLAVHESYQEAGPLPLFIYNHGGGRSGPAGEVDRLGPLMTLSGAAVLSKLQLEHPGRFDAHIIATQGHANNQANRDALIAYVEDMVEQGLVDPYRVYMSGFSMGSMYTLGFVVNNPEFLAAVIPIGGGTMPTQAQINANPEILNVALWPQMHIRDGVGGRNWANYFSTGIGSTGVFREANVSIFESHANPLFPFFGWAEGNTHETEGAALGQRIGTKDLYFAFGAHEEYADLYIFDWLFAQSRADEIEVRDASFDLISFTYAWSEKLTAIVIDLGEGNSIATSELNNDTFNVHAIHNRPTGNAWFFMNRDRVVSNIYTSNINDWGTPADEGRFIVVEFKVWGPYGGLATGDGGGRLRFQYTVTANENAPLLCGELTLDNFNFVQSNLNPDGFGWTRNAIIDQFETTFNRSVEGIGGTLTYSTFLSRDVSGAPLLNRPLFIHFHGGGQGSDWRQPLGYSNNATLLAEPQWQERYQSHIMAPINATSINAQAILATVVREMAEAGLVDINRVYISGYSMGGTATLNFMLRHPELVAAAIPICPANNPNLMSLAEIEIIRDIPQWWLNSEGEYSNAGHATIWTNVERFFGRAGGRLTARACRVNPIARPAIDELLTVDGNGNLLNDVRYTRFWDNNVNAWPYGPDVWLSYLPHDEITDDGFWIFNGHQVWIPAFNGGVNVMAEYTIGWEPRVRYDGFTPGDSTALFDWMFAQTRAVDLSELQEVIAYAETLRASDFTRGTWSPLQNALAVARGVAADPNITPVAEANATANLQAAINNLVRVGAPEPTIDWTNLDAVITTGAAIEELGQSGNPRAQWSMFRTALDNARATRANAATTQAQADVAEALLNAAINNLPNRP